MHHEPRFREFVTSPILGLPRWDGAQIRTMPRCEITSAWIARMTQLHAERLATFRAWREAQLLRARECIASLPTGDVSVSAIRGATSLALFGGDDIGGCAADVYPTVDTLDEPNCGAHIHVRVETSYGGGSGWIGPMGTRVYERFYAVPGGSAWQTPKKDPELERLRLALFAWREQYFRENGWGGWFPTVDTARLPASLLA